MTALLVVMILAGALAAFVLAPLFRENAGDAERVAQRLSEEQDLASQREMALAALRDLEDDRATGKIGDDDYAAMKATLSVRAVEILKRLDALTAPGRPMSVPPAPVADPGSDADR